MMKSHERSYLTSIPLFESRRQSGAEIRIAHPDYFEFSAGPNMRCIFAIGDQHLGQRIIQIGFPALASFDREVGSIIWQFLVM